MSTLEESKASFITILNEVDFNYKELDDTRITLGMSGDNAKSVNYIVTFDESGESVSIMGMNIACFNDKIAEGLVTINRLNKEYRWIKFVIDEDSDLLSFTDAVIEPNTAGKEILEIIGRNFHIIDEAYPEIMREIWG